MEKTTKKIYQRWWFWILLIAVVAQFFDDPEMKVSSDASSDENICFTCYKKFKESDGWCYDIGGIGTRNCSGEKSFCSYSCASKRGRENTPKSWQKQYN